MIFLFWLNGKLLFGLGLIATKNPPKNPENIFLFVVLSPSGVIALFCRQYDIIKDNEPNNNKDKAKNSSECSTPEHPTGGLLRSKV